MKRDKLADCIAYFKKNDFKRLFLGIREKYLSYGRMGGIVILDHISESERNALEGLMQKSYQGKKSISINLLKLQAAINLTRFEGLCLYEIAESYFNESFETKHNESIRKSEEKEAFFNRILNEYNGTFAGEWLTMTLEEKGSDSRYLTGKYNEDSESFYKLLCRVLYAANRLPDFIGKKERLPVFAAETAKDPHFFDEGRDSDTLLTMLLVYYQEKKKHKDTAFSEFQKELNIDDSGNHGIKRNSIEKVEEKTHLLYSAGILKDDISNYTIMYGIKALKQGNKPHKGIEGFLHEMQPVHISLSILSEITKVYTSGNKVYVFENPSVFAELAAADKGMNAFICTNGQPCLSSLLLLDLCAACGISLYYAGDFDPEGLMIAQKLKQRYGERLLLWHYGREDYMMSKSKVKLPEKRLKKLVNIIDEGLLEVKSCLEEHGYAGYQEKLIDVYKNDCV